MMTMDAAPAPQPATQTRGGDSDSTDSDDSDVDFVNMDFSGVDFGDDEEDAAGEEVDDTALVDAPSLNNDVDETKDDVEAIGLDSDEASEKIEASNANVTAPPSKANTTGNDQKEDPIASDSLSTLASSSSSTKKSLSAIIFPEVQIELNDIDKKTLAIEKDVLLPHSEECNTNASDEHLFKLLENGQYVEILRSDTALKIFGNELNSSGEGQSFAESTMMEQIKRNLLRYFSEETTQSKSAVVKCIELEVIGIASLNLFLQLNYTGPSMDRGLKPEEGKEDEKHPLDGINPHVMFQAMAGDEHNKSRSISNPSASDAFHNAVLSELAVDGEWPFQVCTAPYFLLLARSILPMLAEPLRPFRLWSPSKNSVNSEDAVVDATSVGFNPDAGAIFAAGAKCLKGASLWNARAIVAHRRLISTRRDDDDGQACPTLWNEAEAMFSRCIASFCDNQVLFDEEDRNCHVASEVMLEWGLAQHHFRRNGRGKGSFNKALQFSKLEVEVTGAVGKRTKFQQSATAQYLVRAKPSLKSSPNLGADNSSVKNKANVEKQMITHDEVADDAILLEKIKFEEQDDNVHCNLSILEQSILLALCLDVKNDNPMDGLTGEQMGAYLARVINQHDDWMVYATTLLERAWLECERTHGRERAILQIQALADQHSNRLTLTQSTFKSVEEDSAPAQDRLRHLHGIVYPPRWDMLRDLAERYAKLGVVTSAAEIFEELELWDEVVECYRIAGKEGNALEVVRARLAEKETPRMHAALGDLTKDPKCFERSLELSKGKFYDAHVALGKYYFEQGDRPRALKHFLEGLEIKPLMPQVWFRVGTISMQLKDWDTALRAFTEVVQQEPEEGDAWANVAAVHMHRKNPAEAYPALVESLKQSRHNWRVWVSKLYTCIDLKKYDEAIQTCTELLTLRARQKSTDKIPTPEEKCIRAIVGGSLQNYHDARASGDEVALDSSKRTLARVRQLLDKMKSSQSEAWLYEVSACFNEEMGWSEDVFNDLMKEYRTLQSAKGWEEDPVKISQMTNVVKGIFSHHKAEGTKESRFKCKLLINGVAKKIRTACIDSSTPKEVAELDLMLSDLENTMPSVAK